MTLNAPTRRQALGLLGAITGLATVSACGFSTPAATSTASSEPPITPKVDGDLVYFNWADYVDPTVMKGFEKEYGVKVIESNFDSMESMVAKLTAGNRYDVIFPSDKFAQRLIQAGKLHRLDHSKLPNSEAIFGYYSHFNDPWYDPKSAHTVPNTMYKTGIGWRKDKLGDKLGGTWNDLWDSRADGRKFLIDDRDEVLGLGALRLGYDINTANPAQLDEIVKLIKGLRPKLRGFSSDEVHELVGGSAWMHQMWSGDIVAVLNQAKGPASFGFEAPREGCPIGSDCYAIPSNAPHPGTAMLFIDYMLRLDNVKKNMAYIGYPMPVHGTENDYAKMVESVPEAVVTVADVAKGIDFHNGTQNQIQARDAAYTQIKAG